MSGSSDGWSTTPLSMALTKPWFEMIVPSRTFGSTTTSNVMVATFLRLLEASAGIEPGVGSAGEWIRMPLTSGDRPAESGTGVPFRVVLPATYFVFTGTESRSTTFTASPLPMFFTVMV